MSHEPAVSLHNVAGFVQHPQEGKNVFSRLPETVRLAANPACQDRALHAAGVEIRCNVGPAGGGVKVYVAGKQPIRAELYLGDHLVGPLLLPAGVTDIPLAGQYLWPSLKKLNPLGEAVPVLKALGSSRFDPALVRILFPHKATVGPVRTRGQVEPARPDQLPPRTLLCYGSSITQGSDALTAAAGYAPRLARDLGMDLVNLGFSSGAHLEPEIADHIAQRRDWHAATLELGINMRDQFTPDQVAERARHFVKTVAATGRPVYCFGLFRYYDDLPGGDAGRAKALRQAVSEAAAASHPAVPHFDISHVPHPRGLCADLLHPSPEGMEEIARTLAGHLHPVLCPLP